MHWWKQVQARIEPHINRALLFAILVCLVILLTYLLGGAGAFSTFRQTIQANAASAPVAASPTATPATGGSGATVVPVVSVVVVLPLQVSPLDIPYDCTLGASGAQQVTLTNPDSAAHIFTLAWNGPSGPAQGFVATVQPSTLLPPNTVPAHGSRQIVITQVALTVNPTSQELWVSEDIGGPTSVVAKVHVWCSTLPITVPTVALTPSLP